ncbi:MFS transporter [Marimonas sp. MJW-29]|uniref:MFS transporter n=1 Tax=Sulfitobacter sediminis TaxID=3234186 RepID=A0ABV3RJJ5_9RHOB
MMPLNLFTSATFSGANLLAFFIYGAMGIMFFFMPIIFIAGWDRHEISVSVVFAPMALFMTVFSTRAGALADRIGPAPLLAAGSLITGAGYLLIGFFAEAQLLCAHILPSMCLVAFGMSLVVAPLSTALMGAAPDGLSGIASGVNNAVSRTASLLGVAAVGGVAATVYLRAGGAASFGIPSDTEGHAAAMSQSLTALAYISAGLCLLSAVISLNLFRRG